MKKKLIILTAAMTLALSCSITVCAQPKTMPDGTVFDAEYYAQTNPDVVAVFGTDANKLYLHYTQYGKAEGRAATNAATSEEFDAEYYAQTNPDVVAVFGTDANKLYTHYLQYGKAEGRAATRPSTAKAATTNASTAKEHIDSFEEFNAEYYMRANADVMDAVGTNPAALYQHYIKYGRAEGRLYNSRTKEEVTNELIQKYGLHVWKDFGNWFMYLGTSSTDLPPSGFQGKVDVLFERYLNGGSLTVTAPSEGTEGEMTYSDTVYVWFVYVKPIPQGVKDFLFNYGTPGLFYNHGYDSYFDKSEIYWVQN